MKYKFSINLDRILAETGYGEMKLIRESGVSHNFINNLIQHKDAPTLEKLCRILNTLNEAGHDIKPSDLITFKPVGVTKVRAIAHQRSGSRYVYFVDLSYQGKQYHDLVALTIKQEKTTITIKATPNGDVSFTKPMQVALFSESFMLGEGLDAMVSMDEGDKKTVAQGLSKIVIQQAVKDHQIKANKHSNKLIFQYFDTFDLTFNSVSFSDQKGLFFTKDKDDKIVPVGQLGRKAYACTYPFQTPSDVGLTKPAKDSPKAPNSDQQWSLIKQQLNHRK